MAQVPPRSGLNVCCSSCQSSCSPPRNRSLSDGFTIIIAGHVICPARLWKNNTWQGPSANSSKESGSISWSRPAHHGLGRPSSIVAPRAADEARKQADRVINAVADGNLGKASAQLQSNGVAPATNAVSDSIRGLLCQRPGVAAPSQGRVHKRKEDSIGLSPKDVTHALRAAKRGGSADVAVWHYEHLQHALGQSRPWRHFPRWIAV